MRSAATEGGEPGATTLTLGSGWAWPATFVALFVARIYLPAHHPGAGPGDGFVAALGALYVLGASLVLPRLVRGGILRAAGSTDSIVLLGRGSDPLVTWSIPARWRIAAIGAGALVSIALALVSAALAGVAETATFAHALVSLALGANVVVAAVAAVPIPGLTGWALLLALVDAAGVPSDQRTRRAARIAQSVGFPAFLLVGIGAALLDDPMLALIAFTLAMFTWSRSDVAVGHDAIARFLASHVIGDVARPVASHAEAGELVDDLAGRLTDAGIVTLVEMSGALVGAIGPRQFAARDRIRGGQRCSEVMVPISKLALLHATSPAAGLVAHVGRHGFALVRMSQATGYVEANDLLERIAASAAHDRLSGDGDECDATGAIHP